MSDRIQKKEFIQSLSQRMETDEKTAEAWLDAFIDTLYDYFKKGLSVTLTGLGSFYLKPKREGCVFKFNSSQKLRALFGWSSTYKGKL